MLLYYLLASPTYIKIWFCGKFASDQTRQMKNPVLLDQTLTYAEFFLSFPYCIE